MLTLFATYLLKQSSLLSTLAVIAPSFILYLAEHLPLSKTFTGAATSRLRSLLQPRQSLRESCGPGTHC
jgi:hypothetical protein